MNRKTILLDANRFSTLASDLAWPRLTGPTPEISIPYNAYILIVVISSSV